MGGRALKLVYTRRYALEEYLQTQDYLVEILSQDFPDVAVPLYFKNKSSFGDIDIICSWPQDIVGPRGEWLRKYIEDTFEPGQIYHNGNSWSFNKDELQVDLIMCDPEHFDSFYHYFSYNDLGNLMGRIAHGLGLKYGQEGLLYDHYFKDINIGRVIVSKDYPRIFEFLGLDYKRWEQGFDDLEDVFEYVVQSEYFNYERYQLNSLNRINRERNLKRESYMKFLAYIENHKDKVYPYESDKSTYLKRADKFFPEFNYDLEVRRMEYEKTRDLYVQSKFNGGEIMRRFGLQGKEISETMSKFKERIIESKSVLGGLTYGPPYNEDEFKIYILETSLDNIYYHFQLFLKDLSRERL